MRATERLTQITSDPEVAAKAWDKAKLRAASRTKTDRGSAEARGAAEMLVSAGERRGGRPSKYSLTLIARICKSVREGCSREAAASLNGISVATL